MLKNNLKLVFRNSIKHKRFFFVSVLSLAIGITTSALLWMHINYERSYDKFYRQTDNLYRVTYNVTGNGKTLINSAKTPTALSVVLPAETKSVAASSRVYYEECYMYTEDVKLFNQKVVWADSSFLNVFQPDMVLGDINTSLENKYSVVISDKTAQIYFGKENPIGKIIKLNEGIAFSVTGVFKQLPANAHLNYDFIVSFHTLEDYGINRNGNWGRNWISTYIRTKQGVKKEEIENTLSAIADKYITGSKEKNLEVKFSLMPLSDIYLHTNLEGEFKPQGDYSKIVLLIIIAVLVIVIASANSINISTALSFERAKESGIRKLNGANNRSLFAYFITESFIINITAILLSQLIVFAVFPVFKTMVNGAIDVKALFHFWYWGIIGIFLIIGILCTGVLPAIIQSSFNTLQLIKNKYGDKYSFSNFRNSLTVFQFSLAIILIVSSILIFKQLKFLQSQDLGIKANQVLVMRGPATNNTTGKKRYVEFCSFREELLQSPYFKSVTATMNVPGQSNRHKNIIVHRNGERVDASFNISMADENYFETYQVPVIEGRNFSKSIDNERGSIVINEKAMEAMGFESGIQAIGKKVKVRGQEKEIIGIVKNFHHESLQKALEPYLYEFRHPHEFGYYPALVSTENIQEAINTAERAWENHYPEAQTDFFFLDEFFNRQYLSYSKLGKLVGISTFLAIFIACLGLFALVSYTVNKKVKEIGVRKVNGATVTEILTMLNTDFVKWVVIAFVIACPISIYGMNKWLENFAYKTTLSWWVFALAGVLTFGIALLTVSRQSWLAATRNPVEALRYE